MPLDIHNTLYMLAAVEDLPIEHTFFRDRYFPTNIKLDIFGTAKVLADYKEGSRKMAPFVLPRLGGIPIGRDGFSTFELEPGNISVSRPLTADQLKNRGFGESIMSTNTPEERARMLMMNDLTELSNTISRREEWTAIQTMLNNGCTMRHETEVKDVYVDVEAKFYDEEKNPAEFTPSAKWEHSKMVNGDWVMGSWYADICAMIKFLVSHGRPARDLIVSTDVGEFLQTDPWIIAMLDNRRIEMGRIAPEALTDSVTNLGVINFNGRKPDVLIDDGTYEDDDGKDKPYMDEESVIVVGCLGDILFEVSAETVRTVSNFTWSGSPV